MVNNAPVPPESPVHRPGRGPYVAGVILLVLGGLLLVSEVLTRTNMGWWDWPWTVLLVGVGLLVAGVLLHRPGNPGLLVPGAIVLAVGGVLWYQNASGNWESWSYLWPIVAPGGVAVALLLGALLDGDGAEARRALVLLLVSAALLFAFALFFEGFIFGSWTLPSWLLAPWTGAALVMAVGAGLLIWGLLRR